MKPYYADDAVTLYLGDCREVLPSLRLEEAPLLLVTDPPYGTNAYAADVAPEPALFRGLRGAVFGYPETLLPWCAALGPPSEWIVWWPTNGALRGAYHSPALQRETEHIACFGRLLGEARVPKSTRAIDPQKYRKAPDRKACDVWRDPSPGLGFNSHQRLHVNEKPLSLMSRLLMLLGGTGETVLDPFAGSGSTLVAAKTLGRAAIGVEIDERYCEVIARRLAQEVLPLAAPTEAA